MTIEIYSMPEIWYHLISIPTISPKFTKNKISPISDSTRVSTRCGSFPPLALWFSPAGSPPETKKTCEVHPVPWWSLNFLRTSSQSIQNPRRNRRKSLILQCGTSQKSLSLSLLVNVGNGGMIYDLNHHLSNLHMFSLWSTKSLLLKAAIEIVDLPIQDGDFP